MKITESLLSKLAKVCFLEHEMKCELLGTEGPEEGFLISF